MQLALKLFTDADRSPELERARLAWTCKALAKADADGRLLPVR
jgi:hypothetical protein